MPLATANATNLTGALLQVNGAYNNMIGVVLVFVVMLIAAGATIRWGNEAALQVAFFFGIISLAVMWVLQLVADGVGVAIASVILVLWFITFLGIRYGN